MHVSRRKLAQHVADQLDVGMSTHKVMQQLGAYLYETHRTNEIDLILRDIESTLAKKGSVLARVTSARAITDEMKRTLTSLVKDYTSSQRVTLSETIDETVIGGVKVEFAGHVLDTTIKTKLDKLSV